MPATRHELRGLYAITDSQLQSREQLVERVEAAIDGGAVLIQYRDKNSRPTVRRQQGEALAALCTARGVPLIINDDVQLAAACGAHGVHLGKDDCDLQTARSRLGRQAIIGVSCYNDWSRALRAVAAGADYIAFGRFFPSHTKPQAVTAETDLLLRAQKTFELPITAIGGITPDNGGQLIAAGADLLAVIQGVFAQPDTRRAAQAYTRLFKS
jgi:thiamine-phosphate pyrophosphorylase